jgi:acyl carrier protein
MSTMFLSDQLTHVTTIVCAAGNLSYIDPDEDFYDAGVSSITALRLLMDLEDAFGISMPDDRFINARTPRALFEIVADLQRLQEGFR